MTLKESQIRKGLLIDPSPTHKARHKSLDEPKHKQIMRKQDQELPYVYMRLLTPIWLLPCPKPLLSKMTPPWGRILHIICYVDE